MQDNLNLDNILADLSIDIFENQQPAKKSSRIGYSIKRQGIRGLILHSQAQLGKSLVMRLKDNGTDLQNEVEFWSSQMVDMLKANQLISFDIVTNPPSSKKTSYHLATQLGRWVAQKLELPYQELFRNNAPRGNRATIHTKLQETKDYAYLKTPDNSSVLVVDDAIHTRQTARACLDISWGDNLTFCFLYGN